MPQKVYTHLYLTALVLGIGVVIANEMLLGSVRYPFTPDSASYIESARNITRGNGVAVTANLQQLDVALVPLKLFPPGYPTMIAAVSLLGLDAPDTALWISRLAWALLPVLVVFALRPVLSARAVIAVAALVVISPGMQTYGWKALSDGPFLALTLLSIGCLIRAVRGNDSAAWFVASGLIMGLCYAVRNTTLAGIAATGAAIAGSVILRQASLKQGFRNMLWWTAGAALPILMVAVRNLTLFGKFQPYSMPPSTIGLVANARMMLFQMLTDLTASSFVGNLAWNGVWLLIVLAVTVALVLASYRRFLECWATWDKTQRFALLLLCAYLFAGVSIVVLARTLYEWGEIINLRHVIQTNWVALGLAAMLTGAVPANSRRGRIALFLLVMVLILARVAWFGGVYTHESRMYAACANHDDPASALATLPPDANLDRALKRNLSQNTALLEMVRRLPPDTLIVSNFANVFRIKTDRAVRIIRAKNYEEVRMQLVTLVQNEDHNRNVCAILFPTTQTIRDATWNDHWRQPLNGYTQVKSSPTVVILKSAAQ